MFPPEIGLITTHDEARAGKQSPMPVTTPPARLPRRRVLLRLSYKRTTPRGGICSPAALANTHWALKSPAKISRSNPLKVQANFRRPEVKLHRGKVQSALLGLVGSPVRQSPGTTAADDLDGECYGYVRGGNISHRRRPMSAQPAERVVSNPIELRSHARVKGTSLNQQTIVLRQP